MTYFRAMGDPITSPSQVDDTVAAEVPPTRVECRDLPANSPWRQPGQVCADAPGGGVLDYLQTVFANIFKPPTSPPYSPVPAPGPAPDDNTVPLLVLGAAGLGAYFLLRKKRRT